MGLQNTKKKKAIKTPQRKNKLFSHKDVISRKLWITLTDPRVYSWLSQMHAWLKTIAILQEQNTNTIMLDSKKATTLWLKKTMKASWPIVTLNVDSLREEKGRMGQPNMIF